MVNASCSWHDAPLFECSARLRVGVNCIMHRAISITLSGADSTTSPVPISSFVIVLSVTLASEAVTSSANLCVPWRIDPAFTCINGRVGGWCVVSLRQGTSIHNTLLLGMRVLTDSSNSILYEGTALSQLCYWNISTIYYVHFIIRDYYYYYYYYTCGPHRFTKGLYYCLHGINVPMVLYCLSVSYIMAQFLESNIDVLSTYSQFW